MRSWIGILCIAVASTAAAQQTVRVTGRLVDRNTGLPITAGNVRLDVGNPVNVGPDGTFRIDGPSGRRLISVRALGYAPWEREVMLARDTSIVADLEPRPFALDTVRAESRMVQAKVTIRDSVSRVLVADVDVLTSIGGRKSSGHRGIVSVDVPIGEEIQASFTAFSYLPVVLPLSLERDTSFTLWLRADPVAARMIEQQIARLAERTKGRLPAGRATLNRAEIMNGSDYGMYTVLSREGFFRRLGCVVIDDVQPTIPIKAALETILPDRVERVERLVFTGMRGPAHMIRVYTREYVRDLMLGRTTPGPIVFSAGGRFCK